jgi:hypothetical protein
MAERKLCLMVTQDVIDIRPCRQEYCAWWMPKENLCAASSLAHNPAYAEK